MGIQKDLKELIEAGVLSEEAAAKIQSYYRGKEGHSHNRLFAIFGVLGAVLVGMGIILIVAHNWDNLSKGLKTVFAFLPLLIGQGAAAFMLWKKEESVAWREGSSAFIFFALGACIALVSQIYNIPGNLASFILTWMLLVLPMVYILRSSIVGLFYLIGITYYACDIGYFNAYDYEGYNWYWLLFGALLPHYYLLFKRNSQSNFLSFFNWLLPLSLTICLGVVAKSDEEWMLLAYLSLFGIFYLIGKSKILQNSSRVANGFEAIGALGSLFILFMTSFRDMWNELQQSSFDVRSLEFGVFIALAALGLTLLVYHVLSVSWRDVFPLGFVFLIFIPIFFAGLTTNLVVIIVNLLVLLIGVQTIKKGADEARLGLLNFGLMIIVVLVSCRFFDTNLSFVLRGLLFVGLGLGFFFTNYWMIKKMKQNEV